MPALSASPAARLARLRHLAIAHGLVIQKSRRPADDGGMMLVELAGNFLVAGDRYSLDLDGVEAWLAEVA